MKKIIIFLLMLSSFASFGQEGGGGSQFTLSVDIRDSLKAWRFQPNGRIAFVTGASTPVDGNGAFFRFDSLSTATENGITIITPIVGVTPLTAGRWIRCDWTATDVTANTNTVTTTKTYSVNSTGTAGTGFGMRHVYQLETSTTESQTAVAVDVSWKSGTHSSRTGAWILSTVKEAGSLTERLRVEGSAMTMSGQYVSTRYALTDGGTIAVDWDNGNIQSVTLGGNRTFTFTNAKDGGRYALILKQDGTGSRTVTWPTIKWQGGSAPTLTTTANKTDLITIIWDGTDYYGSASTNF